MLTQQKKRFQIQKLEERIAPSGWGHYKDCHCKGGDTTLVKDSFNVSAFNGNEVLSRNDVDVKIDRSFNKIDDSFNSVTKVIGKGKHY